MSVREGNNYRVERAFRQNYIIHNGRRYVQEAIYYPDPERQRPIFIFRCVWPSCRVSGHVSNGYFTLIADEYNRHVCPDPV